MVLGSSAYTHVNCYIQSGIIITAPLHWRDHAIQTQIVQKLYTSVETKLTMIGKSHIKSQFQITNLLTKRFKSLFQITPQIHKSF